MSQLTFNDLSADAANPGSGKTVIYAKSGRIYTIDGNGLVSEIPTLASADAITNKTIILPAGVAGTAPLQFTSGTNKTSPAAGEVEYDGKVHYSTHAASERGVLDSEQFITMQGGTYTLASQTAAQKLFNSPTNGAVTLAPATSYQFECFYTLSSMSASSGGFGFALAGTATFTYLSWMSFADKAALATAAADQSTANLNSAANTAIVSATTNTVGWAYIRGLLRVNAGGTVIPQVSLGVAAAAVVGQDSFFRAWPIGSNTVVSVGNWS